jgi:hypothetical protein
MNEVSVPIPHNPVKKSESSIQFVAALVRSPGRRETMRFFPKCSACGRTIFKLDEANLAAVEDAPEREERIGTHRVKVLGPAGIYCWPCDRKQNLIPWANALSTFRAIDEEQRFPMAVRL